VSLNKNIISGITSIIHPSLCVFSFQVTHIMRKIVGPNVGDLAVLIVTLFGSDIIKEVITIFLFVPYKLRERDF